MIKPINEWCRLENSIVPQIFVLCEEEILFFDKMNKHEGRFCRVKDGRCSYFEIEDDIGVILKDGDMFSIELNSNTRIKNYNRHGDITKEIRLEGIFYDLAKDDLGNYIFLGIKNKKFLIEIYSREGRLISSFYPQNLVLGCGIGVFNDSIFLGSLNEKSNLKVIEINYIGVLKKEWEITSSGIDQVIDKILFYQEFMIVLIKGRSSNIAVINRTEDRISIINPTALGMNDFIDININDESMHILDERQIYKVDMKSILSVKSQHENGKLNFSINTLSYRFLMYFIEICRNLNRLVKPITICIIFIATICFVKDFFIVNFDIIKILMLMTSAYSLVIAGFNSLITLRNRGERIDRLLELNRNAENKCVFSSSLLAIMIFILIFNIIPISLNNLLLNLIGSFGVSFGIFYLSKNNIASCNKNMIIELLNDDNPEYESYIRFVLSKVRSERNERLLISVRTEDKIHSDAAATWAYTRSHIINQNVSINVHKNLITTVLDLSKRDIKYSRYSIIMDYICFIKDKINVKEIEIDCLNKKERKIKKI